MSSSRVTPIIPGNVLALDPVHHYSKLISENNVGNFYPAFSFVNKGRIQCVTYKSFTIILEKIVSKNRS